MTRTFAGLALIALLSGRVAGQTPANPPSFDIADVHAGTTNPGVGMSGGQLREGRYELHNATMVDLIRTAYSIDAEKVVGGPSWLELDKFTLVAKAPQSTPVPTVKLMLQSLLADRFKLTVHQDTRSMTAYVLTVIGGKPKMKEASGPGGGCQPQPQPPDPGAVPIQVGMCRGITMEAFAQLIPRVAGNYLTTPLVIDQTGLKESWDFEFRFHPRLVLQAAGSDAISLFDALEKQLGLKLELKDFPASAFVVDSVNRTPTPNSPEVAKVLPPPPPAEFEVADVKLSGPDSKGPMARIQPTGLVTVSAMPLKTLIGLAWDMNTDERLDGPKSLESVKVDIVARAFASTTQTDMPPIEIDTLRQMLRTLLIERFKADPSSRTKCQEGPATAAAADPRNRNPVLSRLITCQNMTMAQFAERLQYLANGYVRVPALDATGLEGGWSFTVNFSPIGAFLGGGAGRGGDAPAGPPSGGGALNASEPNGAISLPEALDKQLGLKLELKKRPIPVLVIDHVEEKPIEN
jgi:uncharacterized protein (TIGR03435 family)